MCENLKEILNDVRSDVGDCDECVCCVRCEDGEMRDGGVRGSDEDEGIVGEFGVVLY